MFVGGGGIFIFVCWGGRGVYFLLLFFLNFIFCLLKNTEPDDAGYVIFFSAINASF